jgi:hypothetical protein
MEVCGQVTVTFPNFSAFPILRGCLPVRIRQEHHVDDPIVLTALCIPVLHEQIGLLDDYRLNFRMPAWDRPWLQVIDHARLDAAVKPLKAAR